MTYNLKDIVNTPDGLQVIFNLDGGGEGYFFIRTHPIGEQPSFENYKRYTNLELDKYNSSEALYKQFFEYESLLRGKTVEETQKEIEAEISQINLSFRVALHRLRVTEEAILQSRNFKKGGS